MLAIEAEHVFGGGLRVLGAALIADSIVHVAGWTGAELPTHWSVFAGMVLAFIGVLMRAASAQPRKELVRAHR